MYVLVRKDQPYGQIVVQAGHAAIESSRQYLPANLDHPHLIVCGVRNERELMKESARLDKSGIRHTMFYEADRNDEATALASEPVFGENRKHFKRYRLL